MKSPAVFAMLLASAVAVLATEPTVPALAGYVPCKVHQTVRATFPLRLLHQGITSGEATAIFEIDPKGEISDHLVVSYTHREFADELIRAVKQWKFEPGTIDQSPLISVLTVTFEYTVNGVLAYERLLPDAREPILQGRFAYQAYGASALDRTPNPITLPSPSYPDAWAKEGHTGKVTVIFYIDETGQARVPIASETADNLLASAAVAAVKQWKFQPPLRDGKPVLARAEQEFVFAPKSTDSAGKS